MEKFQFTRDFRKIQLTPTLILFCSRMVVSGIIWYIVLLVFSLNGVKSNTLSLNPAVFFGQWVLLCVVGLPFFILVCFFTGAIFDATMKIKTNGLALFRSVISLALVVGDPLLYFIRKRLPYLVPVAKFKFINLVPIIFVLSENASVNGEEERSAA